MKKLETIYRFFDALATLVKNIHPLKTKTTYLILFLYLSLKNFINQILNLNLGSQTIFGQKIFFPNYASFVHIFTEIFIFRVYDLDTSKKKPLIIDCGANIGLAAIFFKIKFPHCRLICFEPSTTAFKYLKHNLSTYPDVQIENIALGDKNSTAFLYTPQNRPGDPSSSFFTSRWKNTASKEAVKVRRLSGYLTQQVSLKTTIDFLKIDIEGAEESVIKDLNRSRYFPKISQLTTEYHHYHNSLAKILSILEKYGFENILAGGVRPPFSKYYHQFWSVLIYSRR